LVVLLAVLVEDLGLVVLLAVLVEDLGLVVGEGAAFLVGGLDFGFSTGFGAGAGAGGGSSFLKMPLTLSVTPFVIRLKKPGFFSSAGAACCACELSAKVVHRTASARRV
jgi:hypothetical protein